MTEISDEDKILIDAEAIKYLNLAKFIANEIFHTQNLEVGYELIAKFGSEGYFIVKEDEIKEK